MGLCDLGFKCLGALSTDNTGKISRAFVKPKQYQYVLYAFEIAGEVVYIGKTNCLWKRFDTYRNAGNWKKAWVSNKNKNAWLLDAIKLAGVNIWIKECPVVWIGSNDKKVLVTSVNIEETLMIKKLKPRWNIQHNTEAYTGE